MYGYMSNQSAFPLYRDDHFNHIHMVKMIIRKSKDWPSVGKFSLFCSSGIALGFLPQAIAEPDVAPRVRTLHL